MVLQATLVTTKRRNKRAKTEEEKKIKRRVRKEVDYLQTAKVKRTWRRYGRAALQRSWRD